MAVVIGYMVKREKRGTPLFAPLLEGAASEHALGGEGAQSSANRTVALGTFGLVEPPALFESSGHASEALFTESITLEDTEGVARLNPFNEMIDSDDDAERGE